MVRTVIVPLDGSERAARILGPADWLAEALDADLVIVTSTFAGDTTRDEAILARALARTTCGHARTTLGRGAYPAGDILQIAAESPEPMICMATHGRRALPTMVVGSVAHEVLTRCGAPMMLVGPRFEVRPPQTEDVVIAVQDRPEASSAIPVAADIARALALRVHVVHVGRAAAPAMADPVAAATARHLQEEDVDARAWDLVAEGVASPILALVRSLDARFLAIGCNPCPDGIERAMGRTALDLLRDAPCPVILEHPL
jgi:nucleotide-binding universal stress UspA family protein